MIAMRAEEFSDYEVQSKLDYELTDREALVLEPSDRVIHSYPVYECTADGTEWVKKFFRYTPLRVVARYSNFRGVRKRNAPEVAAL